MQHLCAILEKSDVQFAVAEAIKGKHIFQFLVSGESLDTLLLASEEMKLYQRKSGEKNLRMKKGKEGEDGS